jgi:hypothetical protein
MPRKPPTHKRTLRPSGKAYTSQLDIFARAFPTEDELRQVIADLLRKIGHTGVRITHGTNEKGKDIVLYSEGPLGERRLYACVVKNAPITGQADDHKSGAPTLLNRIQGVLNQIESAFNEPLPNGRGTDEWVDSVYVISPYECAPATIESVKTRLQRGGQISFKCGSALLELFAKHWREFLWFESTVLLSYLSELRKGLEEDYALAQLILQKSYLAASPGSLSDLYVEPTFHRELRQLRLDQEYSIDLSIFSGARRLEEIRREVKSLRHLCQLFDTAPLWAQRPDTIHQTAQEVQRLIDKILELWQTAYRNYVVALRETARKQRPRTAQPFAASGVSLSELSGVVFQRYLA